jgi:hypothetical protein
VLFASSFSFGVGDQNHRRAPPSDSIELKSGEVGLHELMRRHIAVPFTSVNPPLPRTSWSRPYPLARMPSHRALEGTTTRRPAGPTIAQPDHLHNP